MDFKQLLASLLAEDVLPVDADSRLIEAYELDMSVPTARVSTLEERIAELEAENTALKLRNYELIEHGNAAEKVGELGDDEPTGEDTELTIDDLFGDPGEEDDREDDN